MHCVTLSNMPDLEDQLVYLWTEVQDFIRYFHLEDPEVELESINSFYCNLAMNRFLQEGFIL